MRPIMWRVRVGRLIEDWVELKANSALEAELEAAKVPGIKMVFSKSAIPASDGSEDDRIRISE